MIEVKNVSKKFARFQALENINFNIGKGEIVGLLGPNGAGKTTTLRIMAGYLPPTRGKVLVNGIDMMENPLEAKGHLGYMPENVPLYNDLTTNEYLSFFAKLLGAPKDKLCSHLEKIKQKTGLSKVQNKIIGTLSKGYKQRLGLAQALIGTPDILILDEPTIGLDPIQIIEIRQLIKNLAQEQTVILSSHILSEISATCGRILIINKGKIIADGKTEDLSKITQGSKQLLVKIRGNKKDILEKFKRFSNIEKIEAAEKIASNINVYKFDTSAKDAEEKIAKIVVNANWGLLELKPQYLELENIFLKLTKEDN